MTRPAPHRRRFDRSALRRLGLAALCATLAACGSRSDSRPTPEPSPPIARAASICGDPRLSGEPIAPLSSPRNARCGARDPVALTAVAGVRVSPPAQVNCRVARRLADWVEQGVQPAARAAYGQPVTELANAASFSCRTRNHQPGAKLSEHSFANAIDISAFQFAGGDRVTVLEGWRARRSGRFLRDVWRSACGPFGTVLGPESDRFHADHFHFDAKERRTPYCR